MPKSARFPTAVRVNAASRAGRSSGIVTVRIVCHGDAPPMRATCSRSPGIFRSAVDTMRYAMGYECTVNRNTTPSPP
jgi:hypothetical protein